MNKASLVDAMAKKSGLTKKDSEVALNAFMEVVTEALVAGDKVQLVGFGSFNNVKRAEKAGRNPATKQPLVIPATNTAKFKVGKELKEKLNK